MTTVDSLGYDRMSSDELSPLTGPREYPNAFRDVLGKTDEEIATKIEDSFNQLFYGDFNNTPIYYPIPGTDQAYIWDAYHRSVRTEGIGFGMIITVELGKRDEFDRLWQYAKAILQPTSGPYQGYLMSWCDASGTQKVCVDPFGLQQIAMALFFAHGRWGSDTGTIDYGLDAITLLEVMRHKEDLNGGVDSGVTNTFDATTKLVYDFPNVSAADVTRPSIEMPAYYDLWAQAMGDSFWSEAAASARAHWQVAAHPSTGLIPTRTHFDGTPVLYWDFFGSESYRTQLNLALDHVWFGVDPWQVEEADRLLGFFSGQGIGQYPALYKLDGAALNATPESALIFMNGVTGLVATTPDRADYIEAVWTTPPGTKEARYYSGLLHMLSLLTLSGQFRVY
ncbi:glycosyl hydrolase family 8 [Sorangium sp. So ce1000]|uniref:glycosyl hydrolase family 8 n=1 Tax=Sorangium sp. So ce1000 TaxID=3133325 RepID=UPI003F60B9B7